MIYYFTGQPEHGKTTLGKMLVEHLIEKYGTENVFHIDGDDIRKLFTNADYTINGRVNNINTANRIAHYLHNHNKHVVVSVVAPYIDQREDFKATLGENIIEFYIHSNEAKTRDKFKAIAYMKPTENYYDIDTTLDTPEQSLNKIKKYIDEKLHTESR